MKVKKISLTQKALEIRDYQDILGFEINGNSVFEVYEGEPEDNNLTRNFSDCYKIPELLKMAYEAGKNNEEFEIEKDEKIFEI